MLLTISTTRPSARDLSFLLHKHPDKLQSVELSNGLAHIFYPHATDEKCTVALLLEIDPIGLVRNSGREDSFLLMNYVNDRPYVASSIMSVAIAKAFSTAMNGTCSKRQDLVGQVMPFEIKVSVLPAPRGGEVLIRKLFEPLGYKVALERHILDAKFQDWGMSKYFIVTLNADLTLKEVLSHLYVLIPVLDTEKHYWVGQHEVEKLLEKGKGWLKDHPEVEQITKRYLKGIGGLARNAMNRLMEGDEVLQALEIGGQEEVSQAKETLHYKRLRSVAEELVATGANSVIDLGCGEGKLLRMLLAEKQFTKILGVDVSFRELEKASQRLRLHEMAPKQKERIELIQGALTYRDKRFNGFNAAAIVEVIEHLDPNRLKAFERVVFEFARPGSIVLTTPNKEYNVLFETMDVDQMRHSDHRFEWTRIEFESWAINVAGQYNYNVSFKGIGEENETVGAPSQMAIFKLIENE
ncbi:MAG TPA: 3' terminal RNA ribose 2'-O-methyltransferase Hen1 [Cyclobacteriaceae bacterium]|nr:3' terminal RNA ribose 2'-O-methyltransferase Hen1 [Cyclobacteriaceae bacterium]